MYENSLSKSLIYLDLPLPARVATVGFPGRSHPKSDDVVQN